MSVSKRKEKVFVLLVSLVMLLVSSCAMLLQPTTPFDRRRKAQHYGEVLSQSNPDCDNCTDRFLVQRTDGCIVTLVFRYDGRVEIIE